MKITQLNWISLLLIVASFGLALFWYPDLPDPMPTHWDINGAVDDWTPLPWGALVIPLTSISVWGLMALLPFISPKGFRLDDARPVYDVVWFGVMVFLLVLQWILLRQAMNQGPGLEQQIPLLVGALLMLIGNYLPKFPRNFFVGIRTPWTLASREVWNRTHRLGGIVFMMGGAITMLTSFSSESIQLLIVVAIVVGLVPLLYSFWVYRKVHGLDGETQ
jgi:uncharacterized membrane protein